MVSLGRAGLDVFPICLGGNVFGWTADEPQSGAVLDAYTDSGGNFLDTSNSYLVEHGRSETIIGRWMTARGNRHQIVVATKVGGGRGPVRNLRPETIERTLLPVADAWDLAVVPYYAMTSGFLTGKYRPGGDALAWLLTRPRVVAPIASARTTELLEQILAAAKLELTSAEADRLTATTQLD